MPLLPSRRLEVLRALAVSDFRLKYYDSLGGYAWSMLSPLLMLATYYFVFRYVIGIDTTGYLPYLLVGIVYWTFFQDCSFSGLVALSGKAGVLKSIRVSPLMVVIAGSGSTVITLVINSVVLLIVLLASGRLSPLAPLAVVPLLALVLLATGVSLLIAVASVSFRDTGLIWGVAIQALFWLTPVAYIVRPGLLAEVLYLNPLARCLFLIRWFLLYDYWPSTRFLAFTVLACVAVFAFGLAAFRGRAAGIPERL